MNFNDIDFAEVQHKSTFEMIENYIKTYYNRFFYYDILNVKILILNYHMTMFSVVAEVNLLDVITNYIIKK